MTLTLDQQDALTEIANIGIGRAAAALSELAKSRVRLQVPTVKLHSINEDSEFDNTDPVAIVRQNFYGNLIGQVAMVLQKHGAQNLAGLLTEQTYSDNSSIDDECEEVLVEVGNILLNAVLGSMAEVVTGPLSYEIPVFTLATLDDIIHDFLMSTFDPEQARVLEISANIEVEGSNIAGMILIFCEFEALEKLLKNALAII